MVQRYRTYKAAGVPQEMAFSRAEYDTRIARVREAMAQQDLDVLLVHHLPNFCYLAGNQSPLANWYACMILPREGEVVAQVIDIEVANLMIHGWDNENIYDLDWLRQPGAPAQLAEILKDRGYANKRIGLEFRLPGCSALTLEELRQRLPDAVIVDASDLVLSFRAVKSPAEMAHMREAARITDIGMEAGLQAVAPDCTDNDLLRASYGAMIEAGSEYVSIQPLIYAGRGTSLTHVVAKGRTIGVGDAAAIELAGVRQRYSAPLFRTAVVGEPSDLIKSLRDYVMSAHSLLFENARPGRAASDVYRAVVKGLDGVKLPAEAVGRFPGVGYAVGLGFPPDWAEHSMYVNEHHDRLLEEGMCFHAPLSAMVLGKVAVVVSECWTVTASGVEPLSKLPRELTVVPATR